MLNRRDFLAAGGAALIGPSLFHSAQAETSTPGRLAVVTTKWTYGTHAWHMAERFLHGYPLRGKWHDPQWQVVSAYVDQRPEGDLSSDRAKRHGFTVYPTVAEALRCGGSKMAVDAVLLIGEHGDYALNEFGQKLYPRYELFTQIADVFEKDGRSAPVFNDKHLSWKFAWAKEMVERSRELRFPLLAGSSLPVTWRMPAVDLPHGAEVENSLVIAYGGKDVYDFHAIETLQCMLQRRKGGETGIRKVTGLEKEAVWSHLRNPQQDGSCWDPRLVEACLSRSQTLRQPETFSHRLPDAEQIQKWVKEPRAFVFEYTDGTTGTMLMLNGLVRDFTFAARIKGQDEPISTLFYLPPTPNVVYSAALMHHAETMFNTGKTPYPIERTLLTSGMVEAGLQSLKRGRPQETPHLDVRYSVPEAPVFWER